MNIARLAFRSLIFCCVCSVGMVAGEAWGAELRLFNWSDYTSPELIAKFERETGIKVTIATFETSEAARVKLETGKSGYDLAVMSEYFIPGLREKGAIEKTNAYRLPGFERIEQNWRGLYFDPANEYTIPWHWGTTSFQVDTAVYKGDIDTLATLFDPPAPLRGHPIGMLAESDDVVLMALRYMGLPACDVKPEDLQRVREFLAARMANFEVYDADGIVERLTTTTEVNMAWNGDSMRAREKRPSLRYAYPREGTSVWMDVLVMPRHARNRDSVQAFLAFMLRPENAALQSNHTYYANTIDGAEAFLLPALKNAQEMIIPPGTKLTFLQECRGATYRIYGDLWKSVQGK